MSPHIITLGLFQAETPHLENQEHEGWHSADVVHLKPVVSYVSLIKVLPFPLCKMGLRTPIHEGSEEQREHGVD